MAGILIPIERVRAQYNISDSGSILEQEYFMNFLLMNWHDVYFSGLDLNIHVF